MLDSIVKMFGFDFGHVDHLFFAAMKSTIVNLIYTVNRVLLSFIPDENFSIGVHYNRDIFINYKTNLNHHLC